MRHLFHYIHWLIMIKSNIYYFLIFVNFTPWFTIFMNVKLINTRYIMVLCQYSKATPNYNLMFYTSFCQKVMRNVQFSPQKFKFLQNFVNFYPLIWEIFISYDQKCVILYYIMLLFSIYSCSSMILGYLFHYIHWYVAKSQKNYVFLNFDRF